MYSINTIFRKLKLTETTRLIITQYAEELLNTPRFKTFLHFCASMEVDCVSILKVRKVDFSIWMGVDHMSQLFLQLQTEFEIQQPSKFIYFYWVIE